MTPSETLISVVIPTYNYGHLLARAAESVLRQLGAAHELIIIDDGSTDNTPAVMADLRHKYPHVQSVRQENAGPAVVRNRGLVMAKGRFLVFLDADDEMVDGALGLLEAHIAAHPESRFILGGHISVHAHGRMTEHSPDPVPDSVLGRLKAYLLDKRIRLSNGACAMHRDVFLKGQYPEQFRNSEDIPVFAQALVLPCSVLNSPLAMIHKHDDSLRHNTAFGQQVGEHLIAELFDKGRLPAELDVLRRPFTAQRYLSLFRTFASAQRFAEAKVFYRKALQTDWKSVLRWSYTRKALRVFLRH